MHFFNNEFFELKHDGKKVYIQVKKIGFLLKDLDIILRAYPRVKLTSFAELKNALNYATNNLVEIGIWLPSVQVEIAKDKMSASIFIYETAEYIKNNEQQLKKDIQRLLDENFIVHGVQTLDFNHLVCGKATLIAIGTPPVKGDDAVIQYIELPERKPVITEDGKANYFDMNFVNEIKIGDWLGEKQFLKSGIAGINIHGQEIPAAAGNDEQLMYDKQSAYENEEDEKIVLRSKIDGVLEIKDGVIGVYKHLPIKGDVGLQTGNIQFDGSVMVTGTVQAGYSLIAQGDISIEGQEGINGAKLIKSIDGDIFIRGGVFGLGDTRIEAGGNVFIKHVNEAHIDAKEEIHIGFYAMGSMLQAKCILLDERKGKIVGGTAIAQKSIVTAFSGNHLERKTVLQINSLNKQDTMAIVQNKATLLKTLHEEIVYLQSQVDRVSPFVAQLNEPQRAAYDQATLKLKRSEKEASELDNEIKQLMSNIRTTGDESITVTKEAFPGTVIQIGKKSTTLTKLAKGKFMIEFGELNV